MLSDAENIVSYFTPPYNLSRHFFRGAQRLLKPLLIGFKQRLRGISVRQRDRSLKGGQSADLPRVNSQGHYRSFKAAEVGEGRV